MAKSLYEYFTETDGVETTWDITSAKTILAQTFTIGTTGVNQTHTVEEILLQLTKGGTPAGNLTIEIRETTAGAPNSSVLATGTIAMSAIGAISWVSCSNLIGNMQLSASTKYALCIHHLSTVTAANKISWSGEQSSSQYSGGTAYYSIDNGATWTAVTDTSSTWDFDFQIFGDDFKGTLCTYQDVINKAGSGANATARSVSNVSNYVRQCENALNARTKTDWTARYASVSANLKYFLNEIVSSMAAKKVINYSHTGYNSRLEQQQMIETLDKEIEKYTEEIKKEDIKVFVYG
jgi:hypothetical protein